MPVADDDMIAAFSRGYPEMVKMVRADERAKAEETKRPIRAALIGMLRVTTLHGHWHPGSACSECAAISAAVAALGLEVVDDGAMRSFVLPGDGESKG